MKTGLKKYIKWLKIEIDRLTRTDLTTATWQKEQRASEKLENWGMALTKAEAFLAEEKAQDFPPGMSIAEKAKDVEGFRRWEKAQAEENTEYRKHLPPCKIDPTFLCDELAALTDEQSQKPTADGSFYEEIKSCLIAWDKLGWLAGACFAEGVEVLSRYTPTTVKPVEDVLRDKWTKEFCKDYVETSGIFMEGPITSHETLEEFLLAGIKEQNKRFL